MENQLEKRPVIICPGFHKPQLTEQFVQSVFSPSQALDRFRPLVVEALCADPIAIFNWMTRSLGPPAETQPVLAIGFSGGVVGITGALLLWQQQGGKVAKLIAIDGWGMPVVGLPVCRVSHDAFTHWSMLPLGAGDVNFYADPAVDHLQIWGEPERVAGNVMTGWHPQPIQTMSATAFVRQSLRQPDI